MHVVDGKQQSCYHHNQHHYDNCHWNSHADNFFFFKQGMKILTSCWQVDIPNLSENDDMSLCNVGTCSSGTVVLVSQVVTIKLNSSPVVKQQVNTWCVSNSG